MDNGMYEKFIQKIKSHFGTNSLLMYSKSCDYFQLNPIKNDDIKMYYEYLTDKATNKNKSINDLACCLYYLSKDNKEYQETFHSTIIEQLDINEDEVNDENMFKIFNIIEFDEKYLKSDKIKLEYLLNYLEKFGSLPKSITNFLLYKYYFGSLKLKLGDLKTANKEFLEIVMAYTEDIVKAKKETKYTLFIKLKNELLNLRITKCSQGDDIRQTRLFLKELYEETKNENQCLAIKIGFELYDFFLMDHKYTDCIDILFQMRHLLKKRLLTGIKMMNAIDFYLAIVSRLGYIGTLINNKGVLDNCIKKLRKSLQMFNRYGETKKEKSKIFIQVYSFLYVILKINSKEKVENQKKIAANFKTFFFPELSSDDPQLQNNYKKIFIFNDSNFFNFIVNLNIINDMNYDVELFWRKKIFEPMLTTVSKNNPLDHNSIITFIMSVYNQINKDTESYCTGNDKKKIKEKIIDLAGKTLTYIKSYISDEPIFQTPFIKGAIVNIISAYGHIFIYNQDFGALKNLIKLIDEFDKSLKFKDNTPSFELIYKIKGDFWLFNSRTDIKASITFYEKALKLITDSHPRKPIFLFNIGYCYYLQEEKKKAIEYINKCIYEFNNVENNKSPFDFYYRGNNIIKKMNIAKKMLNVLNSKN